MPCATPRSATPCWRSTTSAARGIADGGCTGGGASVDGVMDAYGALTHLASLPSIDPERIAIVGYAFGANVALSAVEFDGPERLFDRQFAAAVAYYPFCPEKIAVSVPTLILGGALDEWAPVSACRRMMARQNGLGAAMRLIVYPDAHHAFNLPLEVAPLLRPEARVQRSRGPGRVERDRRAAAAGLRSLARLGRRLLALDVEQLLLRPGVVLVERKALAISLLRLVPALELGPRRARRATARRSWRWVARTPWLPNSAR